jgi:D-glycero-D-manno-heptose 1,7-bisphosphate phosphatase
MPQPVIFLDKDGTLIHDVPYNVEPHRIRLKPGACEAITLLAERGFKFIVISNQSGVAFGRFEEAALKAVTQKLELLIGLCGGTLEDVYYCPHHTGGIVPAYSIECACRKPKPGMVHQGISEHDVDVASSWMIGDILDDVEAGSRAGLRTILVDDQHETLWHKGPYRNPEIIVRNLKEAAEYICQLITNG